MIKVCLTTSASYSRMCLTMCDYGILANSEPDMYKINTVQKHTFL